MLYLLYRNDFVYLFPENLKTIYEQLCESEENPITSTLDLPDDKINWVITLFGTKTKQFIGEKQIYISNKKDFGVSIYAFDENKNKNENKSLPKNDFDWAPTFTKKVIDTTLITELLDETSDELMKFIKTNFSKIKNTETGIKQTYVFYDHTSGNIIFSDKHCEGEKYDLDHITTVQIEFEILKEYFDSLIMYNVKDIAELCHAFVDNQKKLSNIKNYIQKEYTISTTRQTSANEVLLDINTNCDIKLTYKGLKNLLDKYLPDIQLKNGNYNLYKQIDALKEFSFERHYRLLDDITDKHVKERDYTNYDNYVSERDDLSADYSLSLYDNYNSTLADTTNTLFKSKEFSRLTSNIII
jgi:hypothetical protein